MVCNETTVEYRDIPDFPGYRVGDDGSVWSRWVHAPKKGKPRGCRETHMIGNGWHRLKPSFTGSGLQVTLTNGARRYVHRLVLEIFVGPCPEGREGCHNDGDPKNNTPDNLRWDTCKNNMADRQRHGTAPRGERSGMVKFTETLVRTIRTEYATGGVLQTELTTKYGVSRAQLCKILKRQAWAHVD